VWPKVFAMSSSDVISLLFTVRWWTAVGDFFPDILETRFHTKHALVGSAWRFCGSG